MYTENIFKDFVLFVKAVSSNLIAKYFPGLYVRLTKQTGRGGDEDPQQIASYFIKCFEEYQEQIGIEEKTVDNYLKDKIVLEYGPGDILAVAMLFIAHGAKKVYCVDRFPLSKGSSRNMDVYKILLSSLDGECRSRADSIFRENGNPDSGIDSELIEYFVAKNGVFEGLKGMCDIVISRSVLEHVNDLCGTLKDISSNLKKDGVSVHKVDLKSHGLDRYREFDFLTWPGVLYGMMYGSKGFPNRWRVDKYIDCCKSAGLGIRKIAPTGFVNKQDLEAIHSRLHKPFKNLSRKELSWLGFWITLEHA